MLASPSCPKVSSLNYEKKFRLADFFDMHWDEYKQSPSEPIKPEQYKAVNAIRVCRTEALGVDYYACPECGEVTKVYHSCKNRFCPRCSWQDTLNWADLMKSRMMAIPHRHVVMTLPHQLNHLIKENNGLLLSILFRSAADTFKLWMKEKYNIKPGIISVLHTFGEMKQFHVHVHMIVSWGGVHIHTNELQSIKGEFVNYDELKDSFKRKFKEQLIDLFDKNSLSHNFSSKAEFLQFIDRINQKKWIIHLEPPMNIPTQVIRYIGRYSKRACLSEYKITSIKGETISFSYKDNKNKDIYNKPIVRQLELNYREFFPLLLQHVPLPYFRLVRYYGVYSNRTSIPKEYLFDYQQQKEQLQQQESEPENWEDLQVEKTGENPLICKQCQTRMIYLHTKIISRDKLKSLTFKRFNMINSKARNPQVA